MVERSEEEKKSQIRREEETVLESRSKRMVTGYRYYFTFETPRTNTAA